MKRMKDCLVQSKEISGGLSEDFPTLNLPKESIQENLQEDTRNLHEEKQHSIRGLQEDAQSSFGYFEGVRVGGKGG